MPQLGNWDTSNTVRVRVRILMSIVADSCTDTATWIPLDPTNYHVWDTMVYLPPNTQFQYKFIRKESNTDVCIFPTLALDSAPHLKTVITEYIAWVDCWGIGSEQGGCDTSVRSAVRCNELALKRYPIGHADFISYIILPSLIYMG